MRGRYNMPSGRVLKKEGRRYSLTVPFDSQLEKADTVELVVRVILPEYAKNVHFVLPEGVAEPTLDHRCERGSGVKRLFYIMLVFSYLMVAPVLSFSLPDKVVSYSYAPPVNKTSR